MEIEFNPSRIPRPSASQQAAWTGTSSGPADSASVSGPQSLLNQLNAIPLVRPDAVAQAAQLVSSQPPWPPDDVLDRISVLIAANLKP